MENRTLKKVDATEIGPNPHNPRIIFEEKSLSELQTSIHEVGILVPLTVYENRKNHPPEKYILLDGERRWRCAKKLEMKEVPINVIDEPENMTQNILYMFNIHHFRKEWELFPTALKLEVIINKLGNPNENILHDYTGLNRSTIRRCKALLWFPKKYRKILKEKNRKISTDFFIELYPIVRKLRSDTELNSSQDTEKIVDRMIELFENDHIKDVKEFRDIRKSMAYYGRINNFELFVEKFKTFIDDENNELDIFMSPELDNDKVRKNVLNYTSYLIENLKEINPDFVNDSRFVEQMNSLNEILERILAEID